MVSVFTNFNWNFSPRLAAYSLREKYVLIFFFEYHLNNIYLIFYIIIFLIEAIFHIFLKYKITS